MVVTNPNEQRRTNTLAIVAFILAFFTSFVGSIIGPIALREIRRTGEAGRGLAQAAVILGFVFTGIIIVIATLVFVSVMSQTGTSYP